MTQQSGKADSRDIASGVVLAIFGLLVFVYCAVEYPLGRLSALGLGFLPAAMGAVLATLGAFIAAPAMMRRGSFPALDLRSLATVTGAVIAFGLTVDPLGVVPAIFALTVIASFADPRLTLSKSLILAAALSFFMYVVFVLALGLRLSMFEPLGF